MRVRLSVELLTGASIAVLLAATACRLAGPPTTETKAERIDREALALIESGADLNTPLDETGATALHRVAADGTPPVARALIDAGADPNLPALPTTGQAPRVQQTFAVAAAADACIGHYAVNQPVVFREGYCHVDAYGPLHYAAERNSAEMIQTLIDGGADPNARGYYKTPLHVIVNRRVDARQLIRTLIDGGADPNRGRKHYDQHPDGPGGGDTPLCWATHDFPFGLERHPTTGNLLGMDDWQNLQERMIQDLLDGGASLLRGDSASGAGRGHRDTVLHCAGWYSATPATVRFLVDAANKAGINDFVNWGRKGPGTADTALCHAAGTADNAATNGDSVPANALALVQELLRLGANPNGNGPFVRDEGEVGPHERHPLLCAQRGRERHAGDADVALYDTMIEVLIAAGAVWPEGFEP